MPRLFYAALLVIGTAQLIAFVLLVLDALSRSVP